MDGDPAIVVVGGGWAGLACASALAESGRSVTLLEERGRLGGRACSFPDPATGEELDNGQHLFMSCFSEALRFLRRMGTADKIEFQARLEVPMADASGRKCVFRCPSLPSPLHLLGGVLGHRGLKLRDKLRLILAWKGMHGEIVRASEKGPGGGRDEAEDVTVAAWLDAHRQTPGSRRALWHPLAVAALNEDPVRASSRLFAAVLRRGLMEGSAGSLLGVPSVPLTQLVEPSLARYLGDRGGRVLVNTGVTRLVLEQGEVRSVRLRDGSEMRASAVVSAVPPKALCRLLPQEVLRESSLVRCAAELHPSPILSIHLWFDRPVLEDPFLGLLDSPIHWIFDARRGEGSRSGSYPVALVTSGARDLVERPGEELVSLAMGEVRRYLVRARDARMVHARVIKERQATFSPAAGAGALRPGHVTPVPNLFLAGDWTDTGLPGTLESAAVSGHRCAELLASRLKLAA